MKEVITLGLKQESRVNQMIHTRPTKTSPWRGCSWPVACGLLSSIVILHPRHSKRRTTNQRFQREGIGSKFPMTRNREETHTLYGPRENSSLFICHASSLVVREGRAPCTNNENDFGELQWKLIQVGRSLNNAADVNG